MFAQLNKAYIISLCFVINMRYTIGVTQRRALHDFIKYVKYDAHVYQTIILFDCNRSSIDLVTENVIATLSKNFPSLKLSFQEATVEKAENLSLTPPFYNPRATTIIVIVHLKQDDNLSGLAKPIRFTSNLREDRSRPKYLILLPREGKDSPYEKLLRQLWAKRVPDASILEISERKSRKSEKAFPFHSARQTETRLHLFNPFTNTSSKKSYARRVAWFPEKTSNLHGYTMKVGMIHLPGSVFLNQNSTGYIVKVSGPDASMMNVLSKAMNFKTVWNESDVRDWGYGRCEKENNTGHLRSAMYNEEEFICPLSGRFASCDEQFYEWSRGTTPRYFVLVVPIFQQMQRSAEWKVWNLMTFAGMVLLVYITSRVLRFEADIWKILYTVQAVLGWTIPREPRRPAERVFFGSILLAFLLSSSGIYTLLSDVNLDTQFKKELQTIQEVLSSNLELVIDSSIHFMMYDYSEGSLRSLLNKATQSNISSADCLQRLATELNIACLVEEHVTQYVIQNELVNGSRPAIRIVEETVKSTVTGLILESGSPYVDRFDKLILRFMHSGLYNKWKADSSRSFVAGDTTNDHSVRISGSSFTSEELMYFLLIGYASCLLAFICELLVVSTMKYLHHCGHYGQRY